MKTCTVCGVSPPVAPYTGVPNRCRSCHCAEMKRLRRENPDRFTAYEQRRYTRFVCSLDGAAWPLCEYDGVSIQRCVEIGNGVGVERVEEEDTVESLKAAMFLAGDENSIESPIFWSVYLRHAGTGESECIADLETKEQALALRKALCLIIGCAEDDG